MTQSKTRAKPGDVLIKTGPGTEDFAYIPLKEVVIDGLPLSEILKNKDEAIVAVKKECSDQIKKVQDDQSATLKRVEELILQINQEKEKVAAVEQSLKELATYQVE